MSFTSKRLASLVEDDLQRLVLEKVPEGKFVDYKEQLPGGTDSDKKEFVADITSFANASGGHLIFGVKEEAGLPIEVIGVVGDYDKEMQRLERICCAEALILDCRVAV